MQVSIETTSGLERRMTVGIPAEQIDSEVQKRLQQAAKTVRLNGFRKGKIPLKVVKQRFGAGVRQEVLGELVSRTFYDAVQQEGVKPAGQPSIEPKQMEEGQDIEFVATFEVYPEVELADTSAFEVERLEAEVTDSDIDNMIETLRKQQADWKDSKRKAQKGDRVTIDYKGTKDGEAFDGGTADDQQLVLGSNSMIPGFEDGIVGMKPGDEATLDLTFPEEYHSEELKGAAVQFEIKVKGNELQKLPELDKEFYAKFGVDAEDEAEFRADVKGNMERELKNAASQKLKAAVMDKLIEANQVDLPASLVAGEVEGLRGQMMQQFGGAQPDMDLKSLLPDDMFKEQAERRVALGLVVGEIVKTAEIQVDADKVRAKIEEIASTYQDPEEVVNYYYGNQQMLNGVESVVLEDQVVDHILSTCKVSDVKSTYEEVIKPAEQAG